MVTKENSFKQRALYFIVVKSCEESIWYDKWGYLQR